MLLPLASGDLWVACNYGLLPPLPLVGSCERPLAGGWRLHKLRAEGGAGLLACMLWPSRGSSARAEARSGAERGPIKPGSGEHALQSPAAARGTMQPADTWPGPQYCLLAFTSAACSPPSPPSPGQQEQAEGELLLVSMLLSAGGCSPGACHVHRITAPPSLPVGRLLDSITAACLVWLERAAGPPRLALAFSSGEVHLVPLPGQLTTAACSPAGAGVASTGAGWQMGFGSFQLQPPQLFAGPPPAPAAALGPGRDPMRTVPISARLPAPAYQLHFLPGPRRDAGKGFSHACM